MKQPKAKNIMLKISFLSTINTVEIDHIIAIIKFNMAPNNLCPRLITIILKVEIVCSINFKNSRRKYVKFITYYI